METKQVVWNIGTYSRGRNSVFVRLDFDGRTFYRHDCGGILPRWMRIGLFVEEIEEESGLRKYDDEWLAAFDLAKQIVRPGETVHSVMRRMDVESKRHGMKVVR